jgi:hypothetical protein
VRPPAGEFPSINSRSRAVCCVLWPKTREAMICNAPLQIVSIAFDRAVLIPAAHVGAVVSEAFNGRRAFVFDPEMIGEGPSVRINDRTPRDMG